MLNEGIFTARRGLMSTSTPTIEEVREAFRRALLDVQAERPSPGAGARGLK
jgi:hypothetical protein